MIDYMDKSIVAVFQDVIREKDAIFYGIIAYLNPDREDRDATGLHWIARTPSNADYSDPEKLKKMTFGKVAKVGAIHEFDTGYKYIVELNPDIFEKLSLNEQKAFAFSLLARINITLDKEGEPVFGLASPYYANVLTEKTYGANSLPSSEILAGRFASGD